MSGEASACERIYETMAVRMQDDLRSLDRRVGRLESVLTRGLLLLLANLLGVVGSLVSGML